MMRRAALALLLAACPGGGPGARSTSAKGDSPPCDRAFPAELDEEARAALAGLALRPCPEGSGMLVHAGVAPVVDVDAVTALKDRLGPDLLAVAGVGGVAVTGTCDGEPATPAVALFVDFCRLPLAELAALLEARMRGDELAGTTVAFVLLPQE